MRRGYRQRRLHCSLPRSFTTRALRTKRIIEGPWRHRNCSEQNITVVLHGHPVRQSQPSEIAPAAAVEMFLNFVTFPLLHLVFMAELLRLSMLATCD
jgi:hypothetical protein